MSVVNTETGEIVESGAALAPIDKTAASVVTVLENAKSWLSTAVEMTGPEEIAAAKAHIRTAETYARELHLSKDIQLDAQEMVRRAEYALGKSIRKGQEEGTIVKRHEPQAPANQHGAVPHRVTKSKVADFAHHAELNGSGPDKPGIYSLTDGVEAEDFEDALAEAKAEKNLSRANVARKVKKRAGGQTRDDRADLIQQLANEGYSSRQMPPKVGVSEQSIRQIARDFGIEIPADKAIGRTRRHNSHRIASETVAALDGLAMGVGLIDYDDLDSGEIGHWIDSLNHSLRVLNRFHKRLKETTQ